MPFKLKTRHGLAVVFSFWGDSEKVGEFFLKASHKTRSYYFNANGLMGFVVQSWVTVLRRAEVRGEMDEIVKQQSLDMQALL